MSEKIMTAGEQESGVIMEFRELIDGNFMVILNGNKLKEKVDSGSFAIDLNSPITGGKQSPFGFFLSHKIKTFMRGDLPEVIGEEILSLGKDAKRIDSFVKKYGFDAIEVPAVRNYFKELVRKARDKNSNENDVCKKKLYRLIVAMSHTDKKVRIISDFSIPDLVKYLEPIEKEADQFYHSVVDFCHDCEGKKSSYSKCAKRLGCKDILDHIKENLPYWAVKRINKCLMFSTPSEYIAETFRVKLGIDRPRVEKLLRYAKHMTKLK